MLTKNGYRKANKRNKYMAENALFIQKHLEKNQKMILWTHNAHIAKNSGDDKIIPMGKYLDSNLGESFYVIGFGFNRGSFLALNNSTRSREDITVEKAEEGSSDLRFSQLNNNIFFLDFRSFQSENKWVLKKTKSRNIGDVYYPNEFNRNYRKHILSESYDGLIFVEMTNPIKMLDFEKLK
jgi:erythromycin esterase